MIDLERETSSGNSFGLFGSFRRLGATAVGILQNRLELITIELKEEKSRAVSLGIAAAVAIFLGFMTVVSLMLTVTFIYWDQRVAVMGGFCGVFLVGALISFFLLKSKLKTPPFAETVAQLKKDRQWLQGR
jgi:uncharacterized membrane protein YqjE